MILTQALLKKCLRVSFYSLLFGTVLFALYFFTNDLMVAFVSVPIVLVIGIYNLKLLLQLVWRGRKEKENRQAIWRTGGIISLNVPVALLYTKLVLVLYSALLVRLVNTTNQPMHNLVVLGCGEERPLADLQPGQATYLWLPIFPACSEHRVTVQYTSAKATQQAIIDGYVVEGRRVNLKLGNSQ